MKPVTPPFFSNEHIHWQVFHVSELCWQITPLYNHAVCTPSPELSACLHFVTQQLCQHSLLPICDYVVAYNTITLHVDINSFFYATQANQEAFIDPTQSDRTQAYITEVLTEKLAYFHYDKHTVNHHRIGADFSDNAAWDLAHVAKHNNLSQNAVISCFIGTPLTVYATGFMPHFHYLGFIDSKIVTPRKDNPRLSIPKGALAIADNQAGIYPQSSPGGWNIIGQINFDDVLTCQFKTGDTVSFFDKNKQ